MPEAARDKIKVPPRGREDLQEVRRRGDSNIKIAQTLAEVWRSGRLRDHGEQANAFDEERIVCGSIQVTLGGKRAGLQNLFIRKAVFQKCHDLAPLLRTGQNAKMNMAHWFWFPSA
ncbi:hypothetical protein U879_13620 [Defluviimonas sp. 20V17]|nr:hypothetical protein U879_13620 [Defluviimonas sp. 20V17]